MARMIKVKLIMELRDQGMARRSIAKTRHMSMGSVFQVFDIADERGITWIQVKDLGEEQVYSLFHPERNVRESVFEELDWSYVHTEMAKVGVNLRLLHDEYKVDRVGNVGVSAPTADRQTQAAPVLESGIAT